MKKRAGNLSRLNIAEIPVEANDLLGFAYVLKLSSKRKTLSLEVTAGSVIVRAPKGVNRSYLADWVLQRRLWVLEKLAEQHHRESQIITPSYRDGSRLKWLGVEYPLRILHGAKSSVSLQDDGVLTVTLGARLASVAVANSDEHHTRNKVFNWYQSRARELLIDKTQYYATELGVSITAITLRQTKTKWGHCTREGKIQYNWLIVLAPEPVVDYLVVHEVCHRVELNHGKRYWKLVESLCPDFQRQRRWLKDWGHTLKL